MSKIIRYKVNGVNVCGREDLVGKQDAVNLCEECDKQNKESRLSNCHVNNKTHELSRMFGITIPIFSCASFKGMVTEVKPVDGKLPGQTEKDSTEE